MQGRWLAQNPSQARDVVDIVWLWTWPHYKPCSHGCGCSQYLQCGRMGEFSSEVIMHGIPSDHRKRDVIMPDIRHYNVALSLRL